MADFTVVSFSLISSSPFLFFHAHVYKLTVDCIGFIHAWQETYSMRSIFRRLSPKRHQFPVALVGNLAYRLYRRELRHDAHRFPLSPEDVP